MLEAIAWAILALAAGFALSSLAEDLPALWRAFLEALKPKP